MLRVVCCIVAFAMIVVAIVGCSESPNSPAVNDSNVMVAAPAIAQSSVMTFADDFESGIDPSAWYCELLGGAQWSWAEEMGNGLAYAPPQNTHYTNNRCVDMLTQRDDFANFTFTWDMRFRTESWDRDRRLVYFRSDDAGTPLGYAVQIGVGVPVWPVADAILIQVHHPDGSGSSLTDLLPHDWELNTWYSFKLEVIGYDIKLKVWLKGDPEPENWFLEVTDPSAQYASGRVGFGNYWDAETDVDNVVVSEPLSLDIKPGSCPNPFNAKLFEDMPDNSQLRKGGVLPVAIVGTSSFDVHDVDVTTILLEAVAPLRHSYEDVTTPAFGLDECECIAAGPDGIMDLTLKFRKRDIAAVIGMASDGDVVPLTLTAVLLDGTPIEITDCIKVLSKGEDPPSF